MCLFFLCLSYLIVPSVYLTRSYSENNFYQHQRRQIIVNGHSMHAGPDLRARSPGGTFFNGQQIIDFEKKILTISAPTSLDWFNTTVSVFSANNFFFA